MREHKGRRKCSGSTCICGCLRESRRLSVQPLMNPMSRLSSLSFLPFKNHLFIQDGSILFFFSFFQHWHASLLFLMSCRHRGTSLIFQPSDYFLTLPHTSQCILFGILPALYKCPTLSEMFSGVPEWRSEVHNLGY